jgi:hypothetical protein
MTASSSTIISRRSLNVSKKKREIDLGNVIDALQKGDNAVIIAFFEQGYAPEKAPSFIKLLLDIEELNDKYFLWKMGLLGPNGLIRRRKNIVNHV